MYVPKKPILLMGDPEHYRILEPTENGHANLKAIEGYKLQQKDPAGFKAKAKEQWLNLKETYEKHATVYVLDADPECPDSVFTADGSFTITNGDTTVSLISNFTNPHRATEAAHHKKFLEKNSEKLGFDKHLIISSPHKIEGTGDHIYLPNYDIIASGIAPESDDPINGRSSKEGIALLEQVTKTQSSVEFTGEGFFHRDVFTGFLSRGHVVTYEDKISKSYAAEFNKVAFEAFGLQEKDMIISADYNDAFNNYACNLVCIGNTVITPIISEGLQERIKAKGYDLQMVDLSHFIASGGAPHCLKNTLNETKVQGGYLNDNNFMQLHMNGHG